MEKDKTCGKCIYFLHTKYMPMSMEAGLSRDDIEHISNESGECRRFPPVTRTDFATVRRSTWCGEFKEAYI
jgi:hypothetical protein